MGYLKYAFVLLLLFVGCKPEDPVPPVVIETDAVYTRMDVSYGPNTRHVLDVMLPAGRTRATKLAILIHGGSWVSGDKSEMHAVMERLVDSGIACVAINYRYASATFDYADLIDDVALAVAYCVENAETWTVNGDNIIIGGVSAGAHLAMLYDYKYDSEDHISGVVSLCGPSDFTDIDWLNYASLAGLIGTIEQIVGASYIMGEPLTLDFAEASPKHYVEYAAPTLLIHGSTDFVVPYGQSYELHNALSAAGVANKLVEYPATGHDLGISDPSRMTNIITHIVDWCRRY